MKKLLVILALTILSVGAYAQKGTMSGHVKGGIKTNSTRFGLGVEGRYGITDQIRIAPDVVVFLPKDHITGLDINVNVQYVFPLQDGLSLYPLAGLNMANGRVSSQKIDLGLGETYKTKSHGITEWGFNIGAGADYDLNAKNYLNAEFRYTFSDWDGAQIMVGYGFRF